MGDAPHPISKRIAALIETIKESADKLVSDRTSRGDLKILSRTLRELRYAFKVFSPYRHIRKVTVFGSARTLPGQPAYQQAVAFGRAMAEHQWFVVTGAASGIMEAGHTGAGRDRSMGLNILLPFEQSANPIIRGDRKLVYMKYFFTRKLMFVKESDAFCLMPGGFGTLDEGLEVLTLLQTGKHDMMPLVLLDQPGGDYWNAFHRFVKEQLFDRGMISQEDLSLYRLTDRVDEAVEEILGFYRVYHSMRYIRTQLVFRLQQPLGENVLEELNDRFRDILIEGRYTLGGPLAEEREEVHLAKMPRLIFRFNRRNYGRLRQLIDFINGRARAKRPSPRCKSHRCWLPWGGCRRFRRLAPSGLKSRMSQPRPAIVDAVGRTLGRSVMEILLLALCLLLAWRAPGFLTAGNLINVLRSVAEQGIIAFGMTMVIVAGEIDLSVGSAVAMSACLVAWLVQIGVPIPAAILLTILLGAVNGLLIGVMRARFLVPSFITSLALMRLLRGIALKLTGQFPITPFPDGYNFLSAGDICRIPVPVVVFLTVFVAVHVLMNYTSLGRMIYAVGGNAETARLSGVNVGLVKTSVLAITSALAAVSGVLVSSKIMSGNPQVAEGWELGVIAAVIIGGTNLNGGAGTAWGTLIGVVFVGVIVNGMQLLDFSAPAQWCIQGLVILAAVLINQINRSRRE